MTTDDRVDQRIRERLRLHLAALMAEHHLNKNQMALRLGVHRATIGSILNGERTMGLDMVVKIHRVFGVSLNFLVDSDPAKAPTVRAGGSK